MPGHGVSTVHDVLPPDELLFPEHLRNEGYVTALFGKLHVSGRVYERDTRHPQDGFDHYEYAISPYTRGGRYNAYESWLHNHHPAFFAELEKRGSDIGNFPREASLTHWIAQRTCAFLEDRSGSQPFFCCMGIVDPHDPYNDYPAEYRDRVNIDVLDAWTTEGTPSSLAPSAVIREHEHGYLGGFNDYSAAQVQEMRLGYFASIALLDDEIGRVLDKLDELGLREDTLVIFTSDHGDMLGDHGLLGKGGYFFDPATRVPLIMRLPGVVPQGTRIGKPVQLHEIATTVCSVAGIAPDQVSRLMPEGRDLVALTSAGRSGTGYAGAPAEIAVCTYRNTGINRDKVHWDPPIHGTMVFDGRYKLNWYHNALASFDSSPTIEGELYDLVSDPEEHRNLWNEPEYEGVRFRLHARLTDWLVGQSRLYGDGRGGTAFPPKTQWIQNNPI
jgi:arylsulfatase A-like enzyme